MLQLLLNALLFAFCVYAAQASGLASNLSQGVHSRRPKGRNSRPRREEGILGRGSELLPHQLGGLGSAESSPSGVRGGGLTANAFWTH